MEVYFDFEFTGLREDTTPISLGCVSENDYYFYAEFYDYRRDMVDNWVQENVIDNLKYNEFESCLKMMPVNATDNYSLEMKNNKREIFLEFNYWLSRISEGSNIILTPDNAIPHDNKLMLDLFDGILPNYVTLSYNSLHLEAQNVCNSLDEFNNIMNEWHNRNHLSLDDAKGIKNIYKKIKEKR